MTSLQDGGIVDVDGVLIPLELLRFQLQAFTYPATCLEKHGEIQFRFFREACVFSLIV
jgi:hypothetical protein